jgi:uncharacterized membrane protein YdjX (TVP38/TMEM64 family)
MVRIDARRILALAGLPLLVTAIAVPVVIWHRELWQLFSSTARLREWVASTGALAPLVFVAVQVLQVVVFVIPGEVPVFAGGYLFGPWLGSVLSLAGILVGSAIDFYLARLAGVPFVKALFPGDQVDRIGRLLESRGARIGFFLLFLVPGIPKDILCYVAGLSPLAFPFFVGVSMLGRLPGIVGSAFIGDAAAARRWPLVIGLGAAAIVLFVTGWLLRDALQGRIERLAGRFRPSVPPSRRQRTARRTPRPGRAGHSSARR